jgi:hypothetical protein
MDNLNIRTIESENEIELFIDRVRSHTGVTLPELYVRNSKVVGVFSVGKLVGGYMVVTKPNFRSLRFVPDSIKRDHQFFKNDEYEMMEINGLWIGPGIKTPKAQFKVWMHLVKDIFFARKKYLLLMSDSSNKTIKRLHSMANPTILFEGAPQLMAGEHTHHSIRVGYTTRWQVISNIPSYIAELRSRERRYSQGLKEKLSMQS